MKGGLTGVATLTWFALRRDRVRIPVWTLALAGLVASTVPTLEEMFPTRADRQARATLMGNPAAVMMSGPGFGLDDYSLGVMVANEFGLTLMVAVAIMSILQVVRHTRAEEESGRAELVRSSPVGRHAITTAALITAAVANLAVAAALFLGLVAVDLPFRDSVGFAAGVAAVGIVFAAVAALTVQVSEHARASSGLAMAVLGASFVVRGVGDILEPEGSALSWLSPIAWAQQTRPYAGLRWWPFALCAALVAVTVVAAFAVAGRRDLGAGLVRPRLGRATASEWLASPFALALRQQRAAVAAWGAGLFVGGLAFGSLGDAIVDALGDNPALQAVIPVGSSDDITDAFYGAMTIYLALGVAAYAVLSVLRIRAEENAGRAESVLATAVPRTGWLAGGLLVTVLTSAVLLALSGLGMGLTAAAVSGDADLVGRLVGAALGYLPAVLVLAGLTAALVGAWPRLAALAWLVVTYALVVDLFGALLGLPEWTTDLSPFGQTPMLPAEGLAWTPLLALTAIAAVLVAAGLVGFRRRDLVTT